MHQKRIFTVILALLAIMLAILPFLVTFNEVLTRLVESFHLYMFVQEKIVPLEVKMVGVLVKPLGVKYLAHQNGMTVNGTYAEMTWNCLGWQSLLLFLITLISGLKGTNYTFWSKTEAILIGLSGTFLVNLLRLVIIVLLLAYSRSLFAVVYHDYLAAIVTVIWLFFFWWFSYGFVLEEKNRTKI